MIRLAALVLAVASTGHVWAQSFTLHSRELRGQATSRQVLNGFGCNGQNQSPQLWWEHAPTGTQSFAVTLFDQSAPTGSGWWHWLIFDIPATTTELVSGAGNPAAQLAPKGSIQSLTDFQISGYGGPCPPPGSGLHRYLLTVYALPDSTLGPGAQTNPATVGFYLEQKALAKASLVFYYKQ